MIIPLEWMPPLMFTGLVVFMIIGYPVAFSLAAVGFFFGFLSIDFGYFTMPFMQAIPGRVFGNILSNELLLAIPFFTFMGAILEKCGLAEDMLESMGHKLKIGNNTTICLEPDSKEETDRLYNALSAGGSDAMPMQDMFWGAYWGTCLDKFGIRWMFNFQK